VRRQFAKMEKELRQELLAEVSHYLQQEVRQQLQKQLTDMLEWNRPRVMEAVPIEVEEMHSNVSWSH